MVRRILAEGKKEGLYLGACEMRGGGAAKGGVGSDLDSSPRFY